eukprot:m.235887 g.235887  ORF g.235887 m.235887 type:complete len:209 (+) comp12898_c0_seq1:5-631(+)
MSDAEDAGQAAEPAARAAAYAEGQQRRGIVYLSRLPPYMRPEKLRFLMRAYGDIDRVYMKQEDSEGRKRREKAGGNKKKKYTEGWVEFLDKKIAKRVALSLNGTQIGGKKSSYYHDDIWCIKYLSKFKWTDLTEKTAYDIAVRRERLRMEMNQVRKETDLFQEQAEKAKGIVSMEERHKRKREDKDKGDADSAPARVERVVKQRKPIT